MQRALRIITEGFVAWVVLFSLAAWAVPAAFAWFKPLIVPGLGVIMFGMGMALRPDDFVRVARMPRAVLCGVFGQFLIMPLVALGLVKLAGLPPELAVGFIILGACPGGTASNVIAFLARADVALSVTMTACSTILSVVLTPALVKLLAGHYLPVDAWGLLLSVVEVVLVPVTAGLLVRHWLKERLRTVVDVFPALSVAVIVLVIACIVALSHALFRDVFGLVGLLVLLHNALGLALGYVLAIAFRLPVSARRTVAIEVGMQNSGLGVALATAHFASPLTAFPASFFSVVHNLTGSALAGIWRRRAE